MTRALAALLLACAALGCAPSLPIGFERERAAAERAYSAGRYEEAAERWLAAERAAERPIDRNEALYRAAASYERAGQRVEAQRLRDALLERSPRAERAARAAYDRALSQLDAGETAAGLRSLQELLERYPSSGLAAPALHHLVESARDRGGDAAARAELERWRAPLAKTWLAEVIAYRLAQELERAGELAAARRAYLAGAKAYPYPKGRYWDDSLWHASRLAEKLGDDAGAVEPLRQLLAQRESARLSGSYERPRFAPAQYRLAELYRDRLRDSARARREFHAVALHHPKSVLVDDALWQEALLARAAQDQRAACQALALLARERPQSRYVACGALLCPSYTPPSGSGECRDYVRRQVSP